MTGDCVQSDGSHVPVRSPSMPWVGGGRWERRPWSGSAAVRWGGGRWGGRVGVPCVLSPEPGIVGRLEGTPRACSSPVLLRPPLCGGVPPPPPGTPCPFSGEAQRTRQGEEKEAQRQARSGDKGAPRRAGNQVPTGLPWTPLGKAAERAFS